ncbi:MAG: methyltransferase domain-containing protein [Sphingopyxis sp.]|nr:methyltransferase domain-containing protein [Sphingopyxis sp.]
MLAPPKFNDILLPKWKAALEEKAVRNTASGKWVLIDDPRSVVDLDRVQVEQFDTTGSDITGTYETVRRFMSKARSHSYTLSAAHAKELLAMLPKDRTLNALIVGGGTIGPGIDDLVADPRVNLLAFDVYDGPNIDFVADGHDIPLIDESIDIIWIQAVLEHVADPQKVAAECERVLREGGIIYAETPFMQQVHSERYDFMRFTALGHRLLFSRCDTVKSGVVDGPGVALIWSLRFFFGGLFRSKAVGRLAGLFFTWLKFFDHIIPENQKQMGACSFYFMGRRRGRSEASVSPKDVLKEYAGI